MRRLAIFSCSVVFALSAALATSCSPVSIEEDNPAMHTYSLDGVWWLEASTTNGESSLTFSSVKDDAYSLSVDGESAVLTLDGSQVSLSIEDKRTGEETGSYKLSSEDNSIVIYTSVTVANDQKRDTVLLTSGYDSNVRIVGVRDGGNLPEGEATISADLSMFSKDRTTGKTSANISGRDTFHKYGESRSSNNTRTSTSASKSPSSTPLGKSNALDRAKSYLGLTAFSRTGLIDQLEYEGFTESEATYAVDNCGANWKEQAAKKAQEYLDLTSFSRSGLIEQLEYEGFTHEQAEYGVSAVGY